MSHPHIRAALTCGALLVALPAIHAYSPKSAPDLTIYGDLRARYEWDWDSQNAAGVARLDRDRAHGRIRAGFTSKFGPEWTIGARVRTGNPLSQQSPHLTFHENDGVTDDFKIQADRYFIQYKKDALTARGGRNTSPFWQQNEMWWDEDITPTGVAASYDNKLSPGTLVGAQLKYMRLVKPSQLTLAGGLYQFNGKNGAQNLRNRNGARDYLVGVFSAQWSTVIDNARPLVLGLDLMRNFESYSTADVAPFAAGQEGEKNGYIFSGLLGQLKNPYDWQVGYYYAHLETLAVTPPTRRTIGHVSGAPRRLTRPTSSRVMNSAPPSSSRRASTSPPVFSWSTPSPASRTASASAST